MYKIESVTDTMEWWTFVGLGNYQKLFTTAIFKTAMMNILKKMFFASMSTNLTTQLYIVNQNQKKRLFA